MQNDVFEERLEGRYVHITKIEFPLRDLNKLFSGVDLYYIFGKEPTDQAFLDEVENDVWSRHLVFRLNHSNRTVGYLRIISVQGIVEIHGGGLNRTVIEKLALSEAWFLIINKCFQVYKVNFIYTSCMINNNKAYSFITGTGFKEAGREEGENRINFKISRGAFEKKSKKYLSKQMLRN